MNNYTIEYISYVIYHFTVLIVVYLALLISVAGCWLTIELSHALITGYFDAYG